MIALIALVLTDANGSTLTFGEFNMTLQKHLKHLPFILGALITLPAALHAAPTNPESKSMKVTEEGVTVAQGELTELILASRDTLKEYISGSSPAIAKERLTAAECVLIFPEVTEAALVVGGKHGDGVASCKQNGKSWSNVAFVDMRGASLGAQLGVKSSSVVMLVKDKDAVEQLKKGKMMFTAESNYVFGTKQNGAEIREDEGIDVEVYSDSEGAFASASLTGSYVASDDDEMKAFYQDEAKTIYKTLSAEPSEEPETVVKELMILLPEEDSVS